MRFKKNIYTEIPKIKKIRSSKKPFTNFNAGDVKLGTTIFNTYLASGSAPDDDLESVDISGDSADASGE